MLSVQMPDGFTWRKKFPIQYAEASNICDVFVDKWPFARPGDEDYSSAHIQLIDEVSAVLPAKQCDEKYPEREDSHPGLGGRPLKVNTLRRTKGMPTMKRTCAGAAGSKRPQHKNEQVKRARLQKKEDPSAYALDTDGQALLQCAAQYRAEHRAEANVYAKA